MIKPAATTWILCDGEEEEPTAMYLMRADEKGLFAEGGNSWVLLVPVSEEVWGDRVRSAE